MSTSPMPNAQSLIPTLVIASHNAGKVAEIGAMLAPLGMKVTSAADAKITEPEETGSTFAENAILKAEHAAKASKLPALADDSGLVVPAIGGAPGIYSARWAGPGKDFSVAFDRRSRSGACRQRARKPATRRLFHLRAGTGRSRQ